MNLLDGLISMVAPHDCLLCGREGKLVCSWCLPDALPILPPTCYRCHALSPDNAVCDICRRSSPLKHVWVRTNYDGLAKELIHYYKFLHARASADDIASLIIQDLPYLADYVLVPVPTATKRVRQRGFDHTKLLAKELSKLLNLEAHRYLIRLGQSQQVGTKRQQRIKQVAGSFRAVGSVAGRKLLLIDDVTTTGATIEEAARVLKRAGAKQVDAIVFAQAK